MALVLRRIQELYLLCFNELKDSRLEHLPFMSSPLPIISVVVLYFVIVKSLGPRLMANRLPYDMKNIVIGYNFLQIIWNFFVAYYIFKVSYSQSDFSLKCASINYDSTPRQLSIAMATYLYFITKIIDTFDTYIYVLRKKFNQISFLHLYHHSAMIIFSYIAVKFLPGGHSALLGLLNSIVHVFMYSYYLLSALDTKNENLIQWKKHLTQIQMCQFLVLGIHYGQALFYDCNYPRICLAYGVVQNTFMFAMFSEFYLKHYIKRKGDNKMGSGLWSKIIIN